MEGGGGRDAVDGEGLASRKVKEYDVIWPSRRLRCWFLFLLQKLLSAKWYGPGNALGVYNAKYVLKKSLNSAINNC